MKDLLQFYNVPIIIIIVCMEIKKVGIIRMCTANGTWHYMDQINWFQQRFVLTHVAHSLAEIV